MDISILKDVLKIQINLSKKELDQLDPYFEQLIYNLLKHKIKEKSRFNFYPTIKERNSYKKIFKNLVEFSKTAPKQRSKEWHEFRNGTPTDNGYVGGTLSASDTGTILGLNPYSSPKSVLLKKLGKSKFEWSAACEHGLKYEEITNMIYQHRTGQKVIEFPCIPDTVVEWIAASPDGITPLGIMVEIKNVNSRTITGYPKPMYYAQMQQQLHVCQLNQCDFVETKIIEYNNYKDYKLDGTTTQQFRRECYTETGNEKGGLVEYVINGENNYLYPPNILLTPNETKKWIDTEIIKLGDLNKYDSVRPIYWKCITYSCIPVFRDDYWWNHNFPKLKEFWEQVLEARKDPASFELVEKATTKKKKFSYINLALENNNKSALFESSSDEEN